MYTKKDIPFIICKMYRYTYVNVSYIFGDEVWFFFCTDMKEKEKKKGKIQNTKNYTRGKVKFDLFDSFKMRK